MVYRNFCRNVQVFVIEVPALRSKTRRIGIAISALGAIFIDRKKMHLLKNDKIRGRNSWRDVVAERRKISAPIRLPDALGSRAMIGACNCVRYKRGVSAFNHLHPYLQSSRFLSFRIRCAIFDARKVARSACINRRRKTQRRLWSRIDEDPCQKKFGSTKVKRKRSRDVAKTKPQ